MRIARSLLLAFVVAGSAFGVKDAGRQILPVARAEAQEEWRKEFDDVCSKTQDAMVLTDDELRSLVGRCDKLKPFIDGLGESQRKVFSRRLQACRDLYWFVLESREKR